MSLYNIKREKQDESKWQHEMVNGENNPTFSSCFKASHRESYSGHFPRDRVNEQNDFFTWRIVNLIEGILLLAAISRFEAEIFVHRETGKRAFVTKFMVNLNNHSGADVVPCACVFYSQIREKEVYFALLSV